MDARLPGSQDGADGGDGFFWSAVLQKGSRNQFRLAEHDRLAVTDRLGKAFQGLARRKNKYPVGGVMVMLFVPLLVLME